MLNNSVKLSLSTQAKGFDSCIRETQFTLKNHVNKKTDYSHIKKVFDAHRFKKISLGFVGKDLAVLMYLTMNMHRKLQSYDSQSDEKPFNRK